MSGKPNDAIKQIKRSMEIWHQSKKHDEMRSWFKVQTTLQTERKATEITKNKKVTFANQPNTALSQTNKRPSRKRQTVEKPTQSINTAKVSEHKTAKQTKLSFDNNATIAVAVEEENDDSQEVDDTTMADGSTDPPVAAPNSIIPVKEKHDKGQGDNQLN